MTCPVAMPYDAAPPSLTITSPYLFSLPSPGTSPGIVLYLSITPRYGATPITLYPFYTSDAQGLRYFSCLPSPPTRRYAPLFFFDNPPFGTIPSSPPDATPPWHGVAVRHSYLDALLSPSSYYLYPGLPLRRRSHSLPPISNQCFWCLSTNHLVADCRHPSVLALASS